MNRTSKLGTSLLIAGLALSLSGCGAAYRRGGGGGGGSASAACNGDFGTTSAAQKIEMFLRATNEFHEAAFAIAGDLQSTCQRMGVALGMSDAELTAQGGDVGAVCRTMNGRLRDEMTAMRSQSQVRVDVQARAPHCEVSVDAYAGCVAECEARVTPGQVDLRCEGGEIRGYCDAQCSGSCAVDVQASCSGVCEGACEGTCSATAADGSCAGQCQGTCHGRCVVSGQASCQGECRGGCSVEYREPYCTGTVRAPEVSSRCQASCDARVEAQARCTPGEMTMNVSGLSDPALVARVDRVRAAIHEGAASILAIRTRTERLRDSGRAIVEIAPGLPEAAATVSIGAVACASAAAASTAEAMSSVSVSVDVSVEVSASFSASASAN